VIPFGLTSLLVVADQLSSMSMLAENKRSNAQKVLTILQVHKSLDEEYFWASKLSTCEVDDELDTE